MSEGELIAVDDSLDTEAVRDVLMEHEGDIGRTARALGVGSERLRRFVWGSGVLRRAMEEVLDLAVDESISVLFEGLRDRHSFGNRIQAAKEFLRSEAGRRRGFAPAGNAAVELKTPTGTLTLRWLEPGESAKAADED